MNSHINSIQAYTHICRLTTHMQQQHINTCTHTFSYIYVFKSADTHECIMHLGIYVCLSACIHIGTCMHIHTHNLYVQNYTQVYMLHVDTITNCTHTLRHLYVCICMLILMHTNTTIYPQAYTHSQSHLSLFPWVRRSRPSQWNWDQGSLGLQLGCSHTHAHILDATRFLRHPEYPLIMLGTLTRVGRFKVPLLTF